MDVKKTVAFKSLNFILMFAILVFGFVGFVSAGSLALDPSDDSWIDSSSPGENNGNSVLLNVWRDFNATSGEFEYRNSLLKFDLLNAIPEDVVVTSATLRMYTYGASSLSVNTTHSARLIGQDWNESDVNWENRPATLENPIDSAFIVEGYEGLVEFDVTDDVVDFINGESENYGWMIMDDGEDNEIHHKYRSSENGNESERPILVIEYEDVPEGDVVGVNNLLGLLGEWGCFDNSNDFSESFAGKDGEGSGNGVLCEYDLNNDSVVDVADLEILLALWGEPFPPSDEFYLFLHEPMSEVYNNESVPLNLTLVSLNTGFEFECSYSVRNNDNNQTVHDGIVLNECGDIDAMNPVSEIVSSFDVSENGNYTFYLTLDELFTNMSYAYEVSFAVDADSFGSQGDDNQDNGGSTTESESSSGSSSSGGGGCLTSWVCEEWSECVDGEQERTCSKPTGMEYCYAGQAPETLRNCQLSSVVEETEEDNDFVSRLTGAVIGANGRPTFLGILIFLLVVAGAYYFATQGRKKVDDSKPGASKKNNGKKSAKKEVDNNESEPTSVNALLALLVLLQVAFLSFVFVLVN